MKKPNTLIFFDLDDDQDEHEFCSKEPLLLRSPNESFPDRAQHSSVTQLRLLDLNLKKEDIPYDIFVCNRATGEKHRVDVDPMIGNQPTD